MAKKVFLHPKKHKWEIRGDFVTKRRGDRIYEFDRTEKCDYCDLERYRLYTLIPQYTKGPLRYKGVHIPMEERISDADTIRTEVYDTTPDEAIRAQVTWMKGK